MEIRGVYVDLDISLLDKVNKIIKMNYTNPISEDEASYIIDDLVSQIEKKQEELDSLNQEIEENYKPIPVAEQYGISDKDFI